MATKNSLDTNTNTVQGFKKIKLLKEHEHAGRKFKEGTELEVLPSESPLAIDAEAAEWLVIEQVAQYV